MLEGIFIFTETQLNLWDFESRRHLITTSSCSVSPQWFSLQIFSWNHPALTETSRCRWVNMNIQIEEAILFQKFPICYYCVPSTSLNWPFSFLWSYMFTAIFPKFLEWNENKICKWNDPLFFFNLKSCLLKAWIQSSPLSLCNLSLGAHIHTHGFHLHMYMPGLVPSVCTYSLESSPDSELSQLAVQLLPAGISEALPVSIAPDSSPNLLCPPHPHKKYISPLFLTHQIGNLLKKSFLNPSFLSTRI